MKNYKIFLLGILSFLALEGTVYATTLNVDVYIEGPHRTYHSKEYPNPVLELSIGSIIKGESFFITDDNLNLSERRLLKKDAKLEVTEKSGQRVIPSCQFQVKNDPEHTTYPRTCGKIGNMVKAYNDAGKPLKSLTFVTNMRQLTAGPDHVKTRCLNW